MKKIVLIALMIASCQTKPKESKVHLDIMNVVDETQKIVSIDKGQKIDTAQLRALFFPTASFSVLAEDEGKQIYQTVDLDDFLASLTDEYYSNGYFETGKGSVIEEYNGIAHVMQSFYGKDSEGEEAWGLNSYQLIYFEDRWKIANMVWTMSPNGKDGIPKKYLEN